MHYFAYFTQNFTNPALIFRVFGRKTNLLEMLRKFGNQILKKIAKNALFLPILHKTLQALRQPCARFAEKTNHCKVFDKILKISDEISIE